MPRPPQRHPLLRLPGYCLPSLWGQTLYPERCCAAASVEPSLIVVITRVLGSGAPVGAPASWRGRRRTRGRGRRRPAGRRRGARRRGEGAASVEGAGGQLVVGKLEDRCELGRRLPRWHRLGPVPAAAPANVVLYRSLNNTGPLKLADFAFSSKFMHNYFSCFCAA